MARVIGEKDKVYTGGRDLDADPLVPSGQDFLITYLVLASSKDESIESIREADTWDNQPHGIPEYKSFRDSAALVRKEAREVTASTTYGGSTTPLWEVDCYYEENVDALSNPEPRGAKRLFDYHWSSETYEEPLNVDAVDPTKFIRNAVGEPFGLETPKPIFVLTISFIKEHLPLTTIQTYGGKQNSGNFWGFPPATTHLAGIGDEPIEIGGRLQRKVTATLKFNFRKFPDEQGNLQTIGWKVPIQNRGTWYYKNAVYQGSPVVDREKIKFAVDNKDTIYGDLEWDGTRRDPELTPLFYIFNRFEEANLEQFIQVGPP